MDKMRLAMDCHHISEPDENGYRNLIYLDIRSATGIKWPVIVYEVVHNDVVPAHMTEITLN
jgi:hypothetical protein